MGKTKISKLTWVGIVLSLLSPLFVVIMGATNVIPNGSNGDINTGTSAAAAYYFAMWNCSEFFSLISLLGDFILLVGFIFLITELAIVIRKKNKKLILNAIFRFLDAAFFPYLLLLIYTQYITGVLTEASMSVIFVSLCLNIVGHILLTLPYHELLLTQPVSEPKVEDPSVNVPSLSEEDINKLVEARIAELGFVNADESKTIADKELEVHVQKLHSAKEEPGVSPSEEPVDGGETDDVPAEDPNDHFAAMNKRHRAKFETRIKTADQELRDKYYELRDYVRSYGIKDRMSVPGVTFSLHRERYVFITIAGKKLKVYFALNPNDYKDSTIPVVENTSKKFEDLPVELKVKSDLSLKRAKALVDDVMKSKGVAKTEGK